MAKNNFGLEVDKMVDQANQEDAKNKELVKKWLKDDYDIEKVPEFDIDAIRRYYKQYGDGFTDDAYEEWANKKGKKLAPKRPFNEEFAKTDFKKQYYGDSEGTYQDQYLNDEDFLRESWEVEYPYIKEFLETEK